jgi:hypothetical protein
MRRTKGIILTAVIFLVIAGGFGYAYRSAIRQTLTPKEILPAAVPLSDIVPVAPAPTTTPAVTPTPTTTKPTPKPTPTPTPTPVVKDQINLAVPFASQAPFGDWSMPYGEACEEASLIMTVHYLQGTALSKQQMKDAIDDMVAWQIEAWGSHKDIAMREEVELAKHFYPKYSYQLISNLTADKIREQLVLGRPVIVPAAGRELHNPNFKQPGPIYHMLVIKGFTKDGKFITNDPGTRNGADYVYTEAVLLNAIHDWTGSAADGEKVGLVMY